MIKYVVLMGFALLFSACNTVLIAPTHISGVEIIRMEEVEDSHGQECLKVSGTVVVPFESDEAWIKAFDDIYQKLKRPGMNMTVSVYLEENKAHLGQSYAMAKYIEKTRSVMMVDGRPIKVKTL